jgi:hypothetical protein
MSIVIDKELRWQEIADELSRTRDKLGKEIDAGIFETVLVLNALDIPTFASCEGHLEWGTCAPWVDVASKHPVTHISIAKLTTEAKQECDKGGKTAAEIHALFDRIDAQHREIKAHHIQIRQKLMSYLAAFYQNRHIPYDYRLFVRPLGHEGKSRLESQGADCQEVMPLDIRAEKLAAYQTEMQAFTAFLKDIYFMKE